MVAAHNLVCRNLHFREFAVCPLQLSAIQRLARHECRRFCARWDSSHIHWEPLLLPWDSTVCNVPSTTRGISDVLPLSETTRVLKASHSDYFNSRRACVY